MTKSVTAWGKQGAAPKWLLGAVALAGGTDITMTERNHKQLILNDSQLGKSSVYSVGSWLLSSFLIKAAIFSSQSAAWSTES